MLNTTINGLLLTTMLLGGLNLAAKATDTPSSEARVNPSSGMITDRLDLKQLETWKAIEQLALAQNGAGQPLRPVLHELWSWAKMRSVPIYIEMVKARGRWQYLAGECVFERQRDPQSSRLSAVTVRLYTTVIDKAPGKRISGERGFLHYEGLRGEERYCETLAHELAHVRQAVTDLEFLQLRDKQQSLNGELLRLLPFWRARANRQSVTKEMRTIADELHLLSESIEGPANAIEREVWRELRGKVWVGPEDLPPYQQVN